MKFEIKGEPMPVVICYLEDGESMVNEAGSMVWMSANMEMKTEAGGVGKAFSRLFSGETMFQNIYTARGGQGMIAFASCVPGSIRAIELAPGEKVVCQKHAFLASEPSVTRKICFQKKVGAGFFGGEGFIMQEFTGPGVLLLELDGSVVEYDLAAGQQMIVDTGNLAYMDATCSIDIQMVKGAKNMLFGGEGVFNTVVTGPGRITLQTMPLSAFANAIGSALPSKG